jgi:hypothetical protein
LRVPRKPKSHNSSHAEETGRVLFIMIPLDVIHDPFLSHAAKLVYGRLLFYTGRDGRCNPSHRTLGAEVCLSSRQVRDVLGELRDRGYITWERTQTTCWYQITGPVPEWRKTADPDSSDDRRKTADQIGGKPPVGVAENRRQKDLLKDHGEKRTPASDLDYKPTTRKNGGSPSGSGGISKPLSKPRKHPRLAEALKDAFHEGGFADEYPSERTVVDVLQAARFHVPEATEDDVIRCLHYLRHERGLQAGYGNGPRHWAWFPEVVGDYFEQHRALYGHEVWAGNGERRHSIDPPPMPRKPIHPDVAAGIGAIEIPAPDAADDYWEAANA